MKCFVSFACALSVLIAVSLAAPLPQESSSGVSTGAQAGAGLGGLGNILGSIDIPGLLKSASQIIGVIRQFCPQLGEIIDNVVQSVTSQVFRVVGRAILQNGGLSGGGGAGDGARKVNVVLPTFPPDDDEDYDEDEEENVDLRNATTTNVTTTNEMKTEENSEANSLNADVNTNEVLSPAVNTSTLYTSAVNENNSVDRQARRVRAAETAVAAEDQDAAASGGNKAPLPAEDLSDVDIDDAERNKRYLPFGGGDDHGGAGSGNFLFDIIRNTADRAARAAGTVYRMIAGTENLGFGLTATATRTKTVAPTASPSPSPKPPVQKALAQLIAGSGATEESDEKEHSGGVAEIDVAKGGDHYTEGIPGPITRLFVVANRGLANLVQDLILRLAQTSERIVNFKARLVTSLI